MDDKMITKDLGNYLESGITLSVTTFKGVKPKSTNGVLMLSQKFKSDKKTGRCLC